MYDTLKLKVTKTETVEVENDTRKKRKGSKGSKPHNKTEKRKIEVERDITILKNTKSFVIRLIQERGAVSSRHHAQGQY